MRYSATLAAALLAATVPALQGCFPAVAAGVGAGAMMYADRRSPGAYIEDEAIEMKAGRRIDDRFAYDAHVNITSFNRTVLLTGEARDAAIRDELARIASGVDNVKGVINEVQVGPISSLSNRSSDAYITSKVKARFVDAAKFSANSVKVVTEAGVVYLIGMVTKREADDASQIAATTGGVLKVVRTFEYVDDAKARQLDNRPPEPVPAAGK